MRGCLTAFYEPAGIADLAVRYEPGAAAQALAVRAALAGRVKHRLARDLVFHLSERRHDREQHGSHWRGCIDVPATESHHAKTGTAAAELFGEGEHVLRRSAESVQSRDDQGVASLEGGEGAIELRG